MKRSSFVDRKIKFREPSATLLESVRRENKHGRGGVSLVMEGLKDEIDMILVSEIIPYKNQARIIFDLESISGLADSIRSQGILQPLLVIPSSIESGKYEVVSGERRLRAAQEVGLDRVPCRILYSNQNPEEIALIENIQREDLHPIELSEAISHLVEKYPISQVEISKQIGLSKSQISQYMAISRLPRDIKDHLLLKKDIKLNKIRELAYLKDESVLREKVFGGSLKSDNLRSVVFLKFSSCAGTVRIDCDKTNLLSEEERKAFKLSLLEILEKL